MNDKPQNPESRAQDAGPVAKSGTATTFHVDIISDVMCPWCYIGKRRFERMAAQNPDMGFQITWLPFQLDPTLPAHGLARAQYLTRKFGGPEAIEAVYGPIRTTGAALGLDFAFDRIAVSPNTINAHRLIAWAHQEGTANPVVEALFEAYFIEGRNIGVVEILADIAQACAMDGQQILTRLNSDEDLEKTQSTANQSRQMGVSGVPTFIIDKRYVVEGAQSPEHLGQAFRQIAGNYSAA